MITKKITEVQQFAESKGNVLQVQNSEVGQTSIDTMKGEIVTTLLDNNGVVLNLVNMKEAVNTYADLPTSNVNINDAYQVTADGLVYVYTSDGFQLDGDGFNILPEPTGIVAEGNTNAVSGNEVYNSTIKPSDLLFNDKYINYSNYIIENKAYDSVGAELVSNGSSIIKGLPLDLSNSQITISNTVASSLRKFFFTNDLNEIIGNINDLSVIPRTKDIPNGATKLNCTLKRVTDSVSPDLRINYGSLITSKQIKSINNYDLEASVLSLDNTVPHPINIRNAVNLEYFNEKAIKDSDLEIETSSTTNKLNRAYIVIGKYIDSSGVIQTSTSVNHIIENHPIYELAGKSVTFNGFIPSIQKKLVFRDEFGVKIGSVIDVSFLPLTVIVPILAYTFDLSIKRGGEDVSSYEYLRLNIGTQSLPYEPFYKTFIKSIKGFEIEGGSREAYDQSLNTTDDVVFKSITTNLINYTAISLDLPQGNGTPPIYVEIGDAWIDTINSSIKVKLS